MKWSKDEEHWVWSRQTCLHAQPHPPGAVWPWVSDVPSLSLSFPTWVSQRAAGRSCTQGQAWCARGRGEQPPRASWPWRVWYCRSDTHRCTWWFAGSSWGSVTPSSSSSSPTLEDGPWPWKEEAEGGTRSEGCVPDGQTGPHRTGWASLSGEFEF